MPHCVWTQATLAFPSSKAPQLGFFLQERALEKRALNLPSRCSQVFSAGLWGFYISIKLDEKLKAEDGGYGYREGEEKRVVADTEL